MLFSTPPARGEIRNGRVESVSRARRDGAKKTRDRHRRDERGLMRRRETGIDATNGDGGDAPLSGVRRSLVRPAGLRLFALSDSRGSASSPPPAEGSLNGLVPPWWRREWLGAVAGLDPLPCFTTVGLMLTPEPPGPGPAPASGDARRRRPRRDGARDGAVPRRALEAGGGRRGGAGARGGSWGVAGGVRALLHERALRLRLRGGGRRRRPRPAGGWGCSGEVSAARRGRCCGRRGWPPAREPRERRAGRFRRIAR